MTDTFIEAHEWWKMTDAQRLNWYAGYVSGVQDALLEIASRPEPDKHFAHGYDRGYTSVETRLTQAKQENYDEGYYAGCNDTTAEF